jgi:hypothetical protein
MSRRPKGTIVISGEAQRKAAERQGMSFVGTRIDSPIQIGHYDETAEEAIARTMAELREAYMVTHFDHYREEGAVWRDMGRLRAGIQIAYRRLTGLDLEAFVSQEEITAHQRDVDESRRQASDRVARRRELQEAVV